jgi:hypothetical protein
MPVPVSGREGERDRRGEERKGRRIWNVRTERDPVTFFFFFYRKSESGMTWLASPAGECLRLDGGN